MSVKHTYRVKDGHETKVLMKAKAIRLHCLDCSGWQTSEVSRCTCHDCALYPFRFGNEKGLERIYEDSEIEESEEEVEEIDDEEAWNRIMAEEK